MTKIVYEKRRLKQGKRPICGIYAFLNGIYVEAGFSTDSKKILEDLAKELWEASLTKTSLTEASCLNAESEALDDSVIGEFFSSTKLEKFLNKKKDIIDQRISPLGIKVRKIECIDQLREEGKKEENTFYIVPINTSWLQMGKHMFSNNMHWLCLKFFKGEWIILDSADNKENEKKAIFNTTHCIRLCEGINDFRLLEHVWKNMQNRKKEKKFYFKNWANKKKDEFEDGDNKFLKINKRIGDLKSKEVVYSFEKSKFFILKVILEKIS